MALQKGVQEDAPVAETGVAGDVDTAVGGKRSAVVLAGVNEADESCILRIFAPSFTSASRFELTVR